MVLVFGGCFFFADEEAIDETSADEGGYSDADEEDIDC